LSALNLYSCEIVIHEDIDHIKHISTEVYKQTNVLIYFKFKNSRINSLQNEHYNSPPPPAEDAGGEELPGGLSGDDIETNWDEAIETFDAMEIPEELLRGIYAYGFEKPSAIQQRAIKPTMMGRDLIAQAQSGTVS